MPKKVKLDPELREYVKQLRKEGKAPYFDRDGNMGVNDFKKTRRRKGRR